jgi:hypothetical protein
MVALLASDAGCVSHKSFQTPREMTSVRDALAYVEERLEVPAADRALRSIAVTTGWPQSGPSVEQLSFMFDPCRGRERMCTAALSNSDRTLRIDEAPRPPRSPPWNVAVPLAVGELTIDVEQALATAGKHAGDEMLTAMGPDTQLL